MESKVNKVKMVNMGTKFNKVILFNMVNIIYDRTVYNVNMVKMVKIVNMINKINIFNMVRIVNMINMF